MFLFQIVGTQPKDQLVRPISTKEIAPSTLLADLINLLVTRDNSAVAHTTSLYTLMAADTATDVNDKTASPVQ